jgi:hypothetical protein
MRKTTNYSWLAVWNIFVFHILGISSSQLTNSYFSEGLKLPTSTVKFAHFSIAKQKMTGVTPPPHLSLGQWRRGRQARGDEVAWDEQ